MRLLLLEDDDRIARDVTATLKAAGYSVERETDGEEGWFKGDTEDYTGHSRSGPSLARRANHFEEVAG